MEFEWVEPPALSDEDRVWAEVLAEGFARHMIRYFTSGYDDCPFKQAISSQRMRLYRKIYTRADSWSVYLVDESNKRHLSIIPIELRTFKESGWGVEDCRVMLAYLDFYDLIDQINCKNSIVGKS